eukprot:6225800-Prymnesium_polylepis.1
MPFGTSSSAPLSSSRRDRQANVAVPPPRRVAPLLGGERSASAYAPPTPLTSACHTWHTGRPSSWCCSLAGWRAACACRSSTRPSRGCPAPCGRGRGPAAASTSLAACAAAPGAAPSPSSAPRGRGWACAAAAPSWRAPRRRPARGRRSTAPARRRPSATTTTAAAAPSRRASACPTPCSYST